MNISEFNTFNEEITRKVADGFNMFKSDFVPFKRQNTKMKLKNKKRPISCGKCGTSYRTTVPISKRPRPLLPCPRCKELFGYKYEGEKR